MSQTKENLTQTEQYLFKFYDIVKKREEIATVAPNSRFNQTELRMISEIVVASKRGERLISSRLAERMNITRSAVSQIVNNLEKRGVVVRVADAVDRKIAYIELTSNMAKLCKTELNKLKAFSEELIERFGEEKTQMMCALFDEFYDIARQMQIEKN